ncbi:MAG: OprO/OprP family phosphate-selective porin [Pseudomonadota bacterium]
MRNTPTLARALASTALVGAMALAAAPARAQSTEAQLKMLQEQVKALQAQIEALSKQQEQAAAEKAAPVKVEAKGAPRFSGDGFKDFKIRGRLQSDFGTVSGSDRLGDPGLGSTTEIRRARLGVEGKIEAFKYKFEVDYADNEVDIADALVSWDMGPANLVIGNQKTTNSMEEMTSSRFTAFLERGGFTDAFGFERMLGVSLDFSGKNYGLLAGVYSDGGLSGNDEAAGYALSARGYVAPRFEGGFAHLGASVLYRDQGAAPTRYRNRPLLHTTNTRFIDANLGALGVDNDVTFGLEAAAVMGPLWAASEWNFLKANLGTPVTGADNSFSASGGFAHVGWFLTGEQRGYKDGVWDRTKPNAPLGEGGMGAFAVNLGLDYTDLSDAGVGVAGGRQTGYLASLMWIPQAYVRFIAQYGYIDISADRSLNGVPVDNVSTFGLRAQIDW